MDGLLWFDDNPRRTLPEKAAAAARRYAARVGRLPTVCYVHPSALNGDGQVLDLEVDGRRVRLSVRPRRSVLRDHLLVGEEEDESKGAEWSSSRLLTRKAE